MSIGYFADLFAIGAVVSVAGGELMGNMPFYFITKKGLKRTRPDLGKTIEWLRDIEQFRNERPIVYYLSGRLGVKHALRKYQKGLGSL